MAASGNKSESHLRRVVIEMSRKHFDFKGLEILESLKIVQMLKSDSNGYAGICRMRLYPPSKDPAVLLGHIGLVKV
jgi:hypothetical protein